MIIVFTLEISSPVSAMRDLEIRGAGNILGARQHGHMQAVGYDLYCKMLNEAVKTRKGISTIEDFNTSIDLEAVPFLWSPRYPGKSYESFPCRNTFPAMAHVTSITLQQQR